MLIDISFVPCTQTNRPQGPTSPNWSYMARHHRQPQSNFFVLVDRMQNARGTSKDLFVPELLYNWIYCTAPTFLADIIYNLRHLRLTNAESASEDS